MQFSRRQHLAIAIILFCALLSVFRLGQSELTLAEDRAISSRFAEYLPLPKLLYQAITSDPARTVRQVRILSVVCSGIGLMLVYALACHILSPSLALSAPAVVAGTLGWNSVARSATPDSVIVVVTMAVIWFVLLLHKRQITKLTQYCAYFLAFAILSFVYPMATILAFACGLFIWRQEKGSSGLRAGLAVILGSAVGLPWMLESGMMLSKYTSQAQVFDYVTQYPFALLLPCALAYTTVSRNQQHLVNRSNVALLLILIAFATLLTPLVFGESYNIIFVPFAAIGLLRMIELLFVPQISPRFGWLIVVVFYLVSLFPLLQFIINKLGYSTVTSIFTILIAGAVIIAAGFALPLKTIRHWLATAALRAGVIIPVVLLLRIAITNFTATHAVSLSITVIQSGVVATP